jgi:hypothetical protein
MENPDRIELEKFVDQFGFADLIETLQRIAKEQADAEKDKKKADVLYDIEKHLRVCLSSANDLSSIVNSLGSFQFITDLIPIAIHHMRYGSTKEIREVWRQIDRLLSTKKFKDALVIIQ